MTVTIIATSCEKIQPAGMQRKIDGSSEAAFKTSMEQLAKELAPSDYQKFLQAYTKLAFQNAMASAFTGGEKDDKVFLRFVDGKTVAEVIQMADLQGTSGAPNANGPSSSTAPPKNIAQLGKPFVIDGVEVTITGIRVGKLERVQRQFSLGAVPDRSFLLLDVNLKNTTEGTIIYVQDVWEHSTIKDNFGNVYDCPNSLAVDRSEVQGVISSRSLKPSEAVTDMMIFEAPLENAKQFVLSSDPNFWCAAGEQRLTQISNDSFRLEFSRADIK